MGGEEPQIIEEVLSHASQAHSEHSYVIMLQTMNSLAEELENITMERRKLMVILTMLKQKKHVVSDFLAQVIRSCYNFPNKVEPVLACVMSWAQLKVQFLACPYLIETLLHAYTQSDLIEPINNILYLLMEKSSYSRSLESRTIKQTIVEVKKSETEMKKFKADNYQKIDHYEEETMTVYSVHLILEFLINVLGPKVKDSSHPDYQEASKYFAELFTQLLKAFPVYMFIVDGSMTSQIYQFGIVLLMHQDNSISSFSMDLWIALKDLIENHKEELDQSLTGLFTEVYDQVFSRLLYRVRISTNREFCIVSHGIAKKQSSVVDVDIIDNDDDDIEHQAKFKITSLKDLRFKADDVFFA